MHSKNGNFDVWKAMLCKTSCVIWWAYLSKIELLPLNGKPNWTITINDQWLGIYHLIFKLINY
jgi:hypothetical protein